MVMYKIKIDVTSPITPSNLIAREIEQANEKYYSGLTRVGVFITNTLRCRWKGRYLKAETIE